MQLLKSIAVSGMLMLVFAGWAGAQTAPPARVGEIIFASGPVLLDGQPAVRGGMVTEGQQFRTGPGGYMYLRTVDKGFLVLRENSLARVVSYRVDEANPANTLVKYELTEGVARHISGEAVRKSPKSFRFNTPVAAIGVRGTDFTVVADAQVMRISVASGGVVVSGFGEGCSPGGNGPCESRSSRELFAGDATVLLQVRRGEVAPELLRAPELRPDNSAPPRSDEPTRTSRASQAPADPTPGLEGHKAELLVQAAQATVPVTPPPPPPPPQVVWGRWQALADLPASDAKLALASNGSYLPASIIDAYFIARMSQSDLVMPKDGVFGFRLTGGEAYLVGPNNATTSASIQNPSLQIDFTNRQFNTNLQVVSGATSVDVKAVGDITLQGELVNDVLRSNATVRGFLSGNGATDASYIFTRTVDTQLRAVGATSWSR